MKGISAPMEDNSIDNRIMTYLKDTSGSIEELDKLIKEYGILKKANQNYLDMNNAHFKREEELKERIKDTMVAWDISKDGNVTIRKSERRTFDFATADCDGFDYNKYLIKKTINTFEYKE